MPITPPWAGNRRHAKHLLRQANLRGVAGYVMAFSDETEDGRFPLPEQYSEILLRQFEVMPEPLFGDDDTQDLIWIVPFPWPDRRIPDDITQEELARIPLLHERVDINPDGTSVAFWDGHVELLTNAEFEQLVDIEQSVCLACEFAMPNLMEGQGP
jgi:prepilin-type processing-associated H-X9-DG protein